MKGNSVTLSVVEKAVDIKLASLSVTQRMLRWTWTFKKAKKEGNKFLSLLEDVLDKPNTTDLTKEIQKYLCIDVLTKKRITQGGGRVTLSSYLY